MSQTIPKEIEEIYWSARHRAETRSRIKNLISLPQEKLIDYLLEIELRIEKLEHDKSN